MTQTNKVERLERVTYYVSKEEKELIEKHAIKRGLNGGVFSRMIILYEVNKKNDTSITQ